MLVVLTQKMNADIVFHTYEIPSRYRNILHTGDVFVYYQGDRYEASQRFYYGVGRIGEILKLNRDNYYAQLVDCRRFEKKVSIYLPDGTYVEQISHSIAEKEIIPWRGLVRELSQQAYDYILNAAGQQLLPESNFSIDVLKESLKRAVRDFYVENDPTAIMRIEGISSALAHGAGNYVCEKSDLGLNSYIAKETPESRLNSLIEYCETMKMSYSYKPVLIMALLQSRKNTGAIAIKAAVQYFRKYYETRKNEGLCVEKKRCIYCRPAVTDKQISDNIIANPVHALVNSGFFFYNAAEELFMMSPEIWRVVDHKSKLRLLKICREKLNLYYGE